MKKLEFKHLTTYLSHKVEVRFYKHDECQTVSILEPIHFTQWQLHNFKLVLKPIKQLLNDNDKELLTFEYVDTDGYFNCYLKDRLTTDCDFFKLDGVYYKITEMPYDFIEYLISKHYDVFGLIPDGLAIDINTL